MLQKNIQAQGLLRTLTALLGSSTVIHLVGGLQCPRCQSHIRNDPEETGDGWRIVCGSCLVDILAVEGDVS